MSALVERLRSHGERVAVLTDTAQLTYRELADRTDEAAHALGDARRLVLLETRNDISTLVHYLGALAARHVVLPVPVGRDQAALDEIYAPGVVIDDRGVHHRHHDARPLHDDLSLLMSTSGSTGSPKLVRLSHANLIENATVIAEDLGIRETDRAATTLPMSYATDEEEPFVLAGNPFAVCRIAFDSCIRSPALVWKTSAASDQVLGSVSGHKPPMIICEYCRCGIAAGAT